MARTTFSHLTPRDARRVGQRLFPRFVVLLLALLVMLVGPHVQDVPFVCGIPVASSVEAGALEAIKGSESPAVTIIAAKGCSADAYPSALQCLSSTPTIVFTLVVNSSERKLWMASQPPDVTVKLVMHTNGQKFATMCRRSEMKLDGSLFGYVECGGPSGSGDAEVVITIGGDDRNPSVTLGPVSGLVQFVEGKVCPSLEEADGSFLCTNPQHGHCDFTTGMCLCEDTYVGTTCADQPCAAGMLCSGHGICMTEASDNQCACVAESPDRKPGLCQCANHAESGHWQGEWCEKCATGWYGPQCLGHCDPKNSEQPCSGHGFCGSDGFCSCHASDQLGYWKGSVCDECQDNYYGANCLLTCPGTSSCLVCSGNGECAYNEEEGIARCRCSEHRIGDDCSRCEPGWIGDRCEVECPSTVSRGVCNDHGVCQLEHDSNDKAVCHCNKGFEGNCDSCSPGYFGPNCRPCPVSGGSICGGGKCNDGMDGDGTCVCSDGHAGAACEYTCPTLTVGTEQLLCGGHGTCEWLKENKGRCVCSYPFSLNEDGVCIACVSGRYGNDCEKECTECYGDAYCDPETGACVCPRGYYGERCELECPGGALLPCSGHGKCDAQGNCICHDDDTLGHWTGLTCSECDPAFASQGCLAVCPSVDGAVCHDRGVCGDGACVDCIPLPSDGKSVALQCGNGCQFTDKKCSDTLEGEGESCNSDTDCNYPQGMCSSVNKACLCSPGYYGGYCELLGPVGENGYPCSRYGFALTDGSCRCRQGHFGKDCSGVCPGGEKNPCRGHGTCNHVTGKCECSDGYVGSDCGISCPGGPASPCSGSGVCRPDGSCECFQTAAGHFDGVLCDQCAVPYAGPSCTVYCDPRFAFADREGCHCKAGYFGEDCSLTCGRTPTGGICDGHGSCQLQHVKGRPGKSLTGAAHCVCYENYYGPVCQAHCTLRDCTARLGLIHPSCHATTGECECQDDTYGHYTGTKCDTCADGYWGSACSVVCPCNGHGRCDPVSGTCECYDDAKLGHWSGEWCDECASGFMGDECTIRNVEMNEDDLFFSTVMPVPAASAGGARASQRGILTYQEFNGQPQFLMGEQTLVRYRSGSVQWSYSLAAAATDAVVSPQGGEWVVTEAVNQTVSVYFFDAADTEGIPTTTTLTLPSLSPPASPLSECVFRHAGTPKDSVEVVCVVSTHALRRYAIDLKKGAAKALSTEDKGTVTLPATFHVSFLADAARKVDMGSTTEEVAQAGIVVGGTVERGDDSTDSIWDGCDALAAAPMWAVAVYDESAQLKELYTECTAQKSAAAMDTCSEEEKPCSVTICAPPVRRVDRQQLLCALQTRIGIRLIDLPSYQHVLMDRHLGSAVQRFVSTITIDKAYDIGVLTTHVGNGASRLLKFNATTLEQTGMLVTEAANNVLAVVLHSAERHLYTAQVFRGQSDAVWYSILAYNVFGVASVYPYALDMRGGATATVEGEGFSSDLAWACIFGDERSSSPAVWESSTRLTCVAPPVEGGSEEAACAAMNFNMRLEGKASNRSSRSAAALVSGRVRRGVQEPQAKPEKRRMTDTHIPIYRPSSATPLRVYATYDGDDVVGTVLYNTETVVRVVGEGFAPYPEARCQVRTLSGVVVFTSEVHYLDPETVLCTQPVLSGPTPRFSSLYYTHDGVVFSLLSAPYAAVGAVVAMALHIIDDASPIIPAARVVHVPPFNAVALDVMGNPVLRYDEGIRQIRCSSLPPDVSLWGGVEILDFGVSTLSDTMSGGVARFDHITLISPQAGDITLFCFNTKDSGFVSTANFTVVVGTPNRLVLLTNMSGWLSGVTSGRSLVPSPQIVVLDEAGNRITDAHQLPPVAVLTFVGQEPSGTDGSPVSTTYNVTATVSATDATYTFRNVKVRTTFGEIVRLQFTVDGTRALLTPPLIQESCIEGAEYANTGTFKCVPCPELGLCDGSPIVEARPGAWKGSIDSVTLYPCPGGVKACERSFQCGVGYEGVLCDQCSPGYGRGPKGCERCPLIAVSWITVLVLVLGIVLVIGVVAFNTMQVGAEGEDTSLPAPPATGDATVNGGDGVSGSVGGDEQQYVLTVVIKLFITYLQIISVLPLATVEAMSPAVANFVTASRIFGSVQVDISSFSCVITQTAHGRMIWMLTLFGCIFVILAAVAFLIVALQYRAKCKSVASGQVKRAALRLQLNESPVVSRDADELLIYSMSRKGKFQEVLLKTHQAYLEWDVGETLMYTAESPTATAVVAPDSEASGASPHTVEKDSGPGAAQFLTSFRPSLMQWLRMLYVIALVELFFLYPSLTIACTNVLSCQQLVFGPGDARSVTRADKGLCSTSAHRWYSGVALVTIAVFGVLGPAISVASIPLAGALLCNGDLNRARRTFFFSTGGLTRRCWFWEPLSFVVKAGLVLINTLLLDTGISLLLSMWLLIVYIAVSWIVRPWEQRVLAWLEYAVFAALVISFSCTYVFTWGSVDGTQSLIILIVFWASNSLAVLAVAGLLFWALSQQMQYGARHSRFWLQLYRALVQPSLSSMEATTAKLELRLAKLQGTLLQIHKRSGCMVFVEAALSGAVIHLQQILRHAGARSEVRGAPPILGQQPMPNNPYRAYFTCQGDRVLPQAAQPLGLSQLRWWSPDAASCLAGDFDDTGRLQEQTMKDPSYTWEDLDGPCDDDEEAEAMLSLELDSCLFNGELGLDDVRGRLPFLRALLQNAVMALHYYHAARIFLPAHASAWTNEPLDATTEGPGDLEHSEGVEAQNMRQHQSVLNTDSFVGTTALTTRRGSRHSVSTEPAPLPTTARELARECTYVEQVADLLSLFAAEEQLVQAYVALRDATAELLSRDDQ